MSYILRGLGLMLGHLAIQGIFALAAREREMTGDRQSARMSKICLVLGLAGTIPLWGGAVYLYFWGNSLFGAGICLLFSLLGFSLLVGYLNNRVTFDRQGFTVQNFWGVRRQYTYGDIVAIRDDPTDVTLYLKKQRVSFDYIMSVGADKFIAQVYRGYWKAHKKDIPTRTAELDFFKGNVVDGATRSFVELFLLGMMLIVIAIFWYSPPCTPMEELRWETVAVQNYQVDEEKGSITLQADGGEEYFVWNYEKTLTDPEKFRQLCREGATFRIGVDRDDSRETPMTEYIEDAAGTVYLTPEIVCFYQKGGPGWQTVPLFFTVLWVLFLAYLVVGVMVGRHPERYPAWLIRRCFAEGTLRVKLKEDPWAKKPQKSRRWPWRKKEEPRKLDYHKKRLRKE